MTLIDQEQQQIVEKKNRRFGQGVAIALSRKIFKLNFMTYRVESEKIENKFYTVFCKDENGPSSCDCPDFQHHKDQNIEHMCKHKWALMHALVNNTVIDVTERKVRLTYKDDEYDF